MDFLHATYVIPGYKEDDKRDEEKRSTSASPLQQLQSNPLPSMPMSKSSSSGEYVYRGIYISRYAVVVDLLLS